jgi:hypothetical protein
MLFFPPLLAQGLAEMNHKDFTNDYSILSFTISLFFAGTTVMFVLSTWILSLKHAIMRE